MDYKNKYLKYKIKYLNLKGGNKDIVIKNLNGLFNEFDKYLKSTKTEINCINDDYRTISDNIELNESLKTYSSDLTALINNYNPEGLNFIQKYDNYSIILDKLFNMYRKINNKFIFEIKNKESIELKRNSREDICNKQININSFHNFANQNLIRFNMLLTEINKNINKIKDTSFKFKDGDLFQLQDKVTEDLCKFKNTVNNINNLINLYDEEKNDKIIEKMMYELICLHQDFLILSNDNKFKKDFDFLIRNIINEYGKIIINNQKKIKKIESTKLTIESILNDLASFYLEYSKFSENIEFLDKFNSILKDILLDYNFIIDSNDYKNNLDIFTVFLDRINKDINCLNLNFIHEIINKEIIDKVNLEIFDNKILNLLYIFWKI